MSIGQAFRPHLSINVLSRGDGFICWGLIRHIRVFFSCFFLARGGGGGGAQIIKHLYYTTLLMLSAETVLFIKQVSCNQVLSELQVFPVYLF